MTQKIDRWHNERMKNDKESFERDEEYVELDRSPTNFSSSDEDDIGNPMNLEQKINEGLSQIKENRAKFKNPNSNPQSFKLSLVDAKKESSPGGIVNNNSTHEDSEFIQFIIDKDNYNLKGNQNINALRRKSLKKNSLGGNSPIKKDALPLKKKMS